MSSVSEGRTPGDSTTRRRPFRVRGNALRCEARVERIVDHCTDTRSLFLGMTEGTLPRFLPGMFISIAIPLDRETRIRPYTIASAPEDGEPFEICFNRVPKDRVRGGSSTNRWRRVEFYRSLRRLHARTRAGHRDRLHRGRDGDCANSTDDSACDCDRVIHAFADVALCGRPGRASALFGGVQANRRLA